MGEMADYYIDMAWEWDNMDYDPDINEVRELGREAYWTTQYGQAVKIKHMTDHHICNWLSWYAKQDDDVKGYLEAYAEVIQAEYSRRFGPLVKWSTKVSSLK